MSLGKQYGGRHFETTVEPDGTMVLKPVRVIPEADAWLYTPEMRERLAVADAWMAEHPPRESDLEQLAARAGCSE